MFEKLIEEIDGTTYSYTYDNANQILTASNQSYTYDSTTKRLSYITKNGINQYFRYDNLGNPVLYKGNGATQPANFVWKQGRELVSGTLNNKNFSYSYDTNGMRYNKVVDNKRTEYYLDGTKILGENRIGHGGVILYIYDETGIAGMIYNSSYYYYEKNVLGDVVAVLDINNNEVASYTYDAWGNVISQSGSMADKNPIRYRSYYYDTETGFYYLQSRYYDPSIRRFINADDHSIIGALSLSAGEVNLYAYCGNNPVNRYDVNGHFWDYVFDAAFIAWGVYDLINGGYKDWKNWVALGVDLLFAVLPFVPSGAGQVIKVGNKIDNAVDVASAINKIDNFQDMSKVTMIGRNMDRVRDTAALINQTDNLYDAWKGYDATATGLKRIVHDGISAVHDGGWMLGKLRKGYTVLDIGITTWHRGWGLYYGAERFVIGLWKTRNIWKLPINYYC